MAEASGVERAQRVMALALRSEKESRGGGTRVEGLCRRWARKEGFALRVDDEDVEAGEERAGDCCWVG